MNLIITGGRIIDPASKLDKHMDLIIEKGKIAALIPGGKALRKRSNTKVIDAKGCILAPGFIDLHVHLREPGFEHKETIATGSHAAVAGGFTTICCMPNTNPVNDNQTVTSYIIEQARQKAACNVLPIGAATKGLEGEQPSEIGELKMAGAVAISDDGKCIQNADVTRRVFEYSKMFGMVMICHAEDISLSAGGQMHEGIVATELGLRGMPASAEEVIVARDIILAKHIGNHIHFAHLSTKGSVEMVRKAKAEGISVTAEATPHHLTLTHESLYDYGTHFKMNPPLRTKSDVDALIEGLSDGTIDAIATDHAPHENLVKELEFDRAAFGIVGLETAFGLTMKLVKDGRLNLLRAVELLTTGPASVLNLPYGKISIGSPADITVFDPNSYFVFNQQQSKSKSKNSPFYGWKLPGVIKYTIFQGKIAYSSKV